jgi:hypothetical protein
MFGVLDRYVSVKTDYRSLLAELVDVHFGEGELLDTVIPDWSDVVADDDTSQTDYVGFVAEN